MDFLDFMKNIGGVVKVFNPVLGSGLITLTNVIDDFNVSDKILEKNVVGLSKSSQIIKDLVQNDNFDKDKLLEVANNLEAMNKFLNKFQKILS